MLHIFADSASAQTPLLTIHGKDVGHMRNVLRLKPGDEVSVSNGTDNKEYRYGIVSYGQDPDGAGTALLRLRFIKEADIELPLKVYLFQGLPKADKMDLVVRKCVELGVYQIIPVSMQRCVMKLTPENAGKKTARWQKISESAASQSRRRIIPEVTMPMTMQEAVRYAREHCTLKLLPYELQPDDGSTKELLESARTSASAAVMIGPEGGFEDEEVTMAKVAGFQPISLGRRILRTETAGMTVMAWMIYITEIT